MNDGKGALLIALRDRNPGTNEASGVPLCTPKAATQLLRKFYIFRALDDVPCRGCGLSAGPLAGHCSNFKQGHQPRPSPPSVELGRPA